MTIAPRLVAPLAACAIAVGAAVGGGACVFPVTTKPPVLEPGAYALQMAAGRVPPGLIVDSAGRTLRVFGDTFNLASNLFYDERAAVAITPKGGSETPVGPFVLTHQSYTSDRSSGTVKFTATLYGGSVTATVMTSRSFLLQMPDHSTWTYEKR